LRQARRWFALERTVWAAQRRRLRAENAELRSENKALRERLDHLTAGMALA
jgi:regulator of replication initiation timing